MKYEIKPPPGKYCIYATVFNKKNYLQTKLFCIIYNKMSRLTAWHYQEALAYLILAD